MGVVLFRPGSELMPLFMQGRVLLEPEPEQYSSFASYGSCIVQAGIGTDAPDNRRGGELLRQLVSRDHTDIRVLSLYAFSAFEQQRFGEAVAAWEMMLKLLPAGDARRAVIERSIRLAQEK
ncbi:tetratricopeptide repeat protein [Salmonella enterica]|uniref:tetratricopeptide repeat protein n=1 Tax=Salmonella enterica TaxID=28901 RepID=UPI003D6637E0